MARYIYISLTWAMTMAIVVGAQFADAQTFVPWNVGTASYSDGGNWVGGFPPYANFDDVGVINNGGTAQVNDFPPMPSGIILGQNVGDSGTLEILSTGSLTVVPGGLGSTPGKVTVGQSGEGVLNVHRGGTLTAERLSSGGENTSSIVLGETGGAGTATVVVNGSADLERNTTVVGPNVDFTADELNLGSAHVLTAEITDMSHSALKASGSASLDGTLNVVFNGPTPSFGDAWDVVDAASITGRFSSVTTNASLGTGLGLLVTTLPGGDLGNVAEVSVGVQMVLSVNRRTGATFLENRALANSVDIDGYLITSEAGTLSPAGWDSFKDNGYPTWTESAPSTKHLGEVDLSGMRTIAADSSVSLGNAYSFTPAQIGESLEDVAFEYHVAGGGTVNGVVEYTGPYNNVVLLVDPSTGEAAIQNQSTFDIDLDGYLITSLSNSLDPGGWTSFLDNGQTDWTESNATAKHIGEVNLDSSRFLAGGSSAISIGSPFDFDAVGVEQDLVFEYHLAGMGTMTGIVEYGAIATGGLLGDYNGNDVIDAADYTTWRDALTAGATSLLNDPTPGSVDESDFTYWRNHFGETLGSGAGSASAAVPEPSSLVLMTLALLFPLFQRQRPG